MFLRKLLLPDYKNIFPDASLSKVGILEICLLIGTMLQWKLELPRIRAAAGVTARG